jgi:hypothetical protein
MRLRSAVALIAASFHLFSSLVGLSLFHFQKKECPYAVAEGGKAVYSVRLLFQPSHNITLTFGLIDPYVRVLTPQLHFTASNWSVPQELFVEGVDDDIIRVSPYPAVISLASQSDNSTYNTHRDGGLPAANLTLLVSETDKAGVFINEKGTYVLAPDIPEGRSRIFLIQLRSIPQSVVTVNLTALNETITIDPTVMVFRPSDWNVTQELTVYTIDDDIRMDSPYKAGVGITMTSGDMDYNGADVEDLVVTIEDNDEGVCVCLCVCLFVSVCLSVYLFVCLFVRLSVLVCCLPACLSVCLFVCLFAFLSVCLSVWLFVSLSIFLSA